MVSLWELIHAGDDGAEKKAKAQKKEPNSTPERETDLDYLNSYYDVGNEDIDF
jgi:hypothetical protein